MSLLDANTLSIGRAGQVLLAGLTFQVDQGEVLLLKGPNGAGKTTLLRTLAGLLPPLAGTVDAPDEICFSGHLDAIKPQLTVRENLNFIKALNGTGDVDDALARWNLSALASRLAADLSAGQRRRLALARLSLGSAKLWLLDEPTSSLDVVSTAIFENELARHLAAQGAAVIATHLDIVTPQARILTLEPAGAQAFDLETLW